MKLWALAGLGWACANAAAAAQAEPPVVGHYYLQGVHEVGSELLLRADGTFEWFISYGAVDETAQGRWVKNSDAVVLTATVPSGRPLWSLLEIGPWDDGAERELRARESEARRAAGLDRCPFLSVPATQAAAADAARQPAYEARRGPPQLDEPAMPPACQFPPEPAADTAAPVTGKGQLAVRVVDPERRVGLRDVVARLHFADGHAEQLVTAGRGLAFRQGDGGAAVAITLSAPFAPGRDQTLALPPTPRGVIYIALDTRQLQPPPFETWRLTVDGAALIPVDFGKGRYVRQ